MPSQATLACEYSPKDRHSRVCLMSCVAFQGDNGGQEPVPPDSQLPRSCQPPDADMGPGPWDADDDLARMQHEPMVRTSGPRSHYSKASLDPGKDRTCQ